MRVERSIANIDLAEITFRNKYVDHTGSVA